MQDDLAKRYQTLVILWFALLMSIVMYFGLAFFVGPEPNNEDRIQNGSLILVALTAIGTFLVVFSFVIKRRYLERSVERQDVAQVQTALIIACAMCEGAAMLGLVERFAIGNRDSYLLILLAALGVAFHFPRRNQLEAASYKKASPLV